ncbi:MAG: hypothetical protein WDZ30_11615, partial [Cellvibrionaceae bacterium]
VMESVVAANNNYHDGWRLLANWYAQKGDRDPCLAAAGNCQRLAPNDPDTLCFVAEKLQAFKAEPERVGQLLERAFELEPSDLYNGLTWIDYAIEQENHEAANRSLQVLKLHQDNAFTCYRAMQLAFSLDTGQTPLALWDKLVGSPDANDWLISHAWNLVKENQLQAQAVEAIMERRAKAQPTAADAGSCLAYFEIDRDGIKTVEKRLRQFRPKDAFDHRFLEAYLHRLIKLRRAIPSRLLPTLEPLLRADTHNWGLLGYLLSDLGKSSQVVNWMRDYSANIGVQAWMLYFYSIALRDVGRWQAAVQVTRDALALEADNYREDIVVWYSLDQLLAGEPAPEQELALINPDALAPFSRYPLALTEALLCLDKRDFIEAYPELSPRLRACQRAIQAHAGSPAMVEAKKRSRALFKRGIAGSFLQRLVWNWRLANHF